MFCPALPLKSPIWAKWWPWVPASSPKVERRKLDVKVGDRVIFGKYSGQTVKADGEELLVMREEDIFGIVE